MASGSCRTCHVQACECEISSDTLGSGDELDRDTGDVKEAESRRGEGDEEKAYDVTGGGEKPPTGAGTGSGIATDRRGAVCVEGDGLEVGAGRGAATDAEAEADTAAGPWTALEFELPEVAAVTELAAPPPALAVFWEAEMPPPPAAPCEEIDALL